ncbi:MAG: SH3 domain-containing protein [Aliidongia sp.]|jgi:SH3-like domain-containing protein
MPHFIGRRLLLGAGVLVCLAGAAAPDDKPALPLPRFVSMRLGDVNLRVGPGLRYPIAWVFTKKDLPVEIIAEFDTWRKIRDWEGTEGWVNHTALAGKRSVMVLGVIRALRRDADSQAAPVAQLEPGVIGKLLECPAVSADWCRIEAGDVRGWIRRDEIWGVYPRETYPL